jgi:hypothetical protein
MKMKTLLVINVVLGTMCTLRADSLVAWTEALDRELPASVKSQEAVRSTNLQFATRFYDSVKPRYILRYDTFTFGLTDSKGAEDPGGV